MGTGTRAAERARSNGLEFTTLPKLSLENVQCQPTIRVTSYVLLLCHLSFCDLLYCTINLPLTALTYSFALSPDYPQSIPSRTFCTAAALMRYNIASVEWMTLGLLAIKRCVDLNRARNAHVFRPKSVGFMLVAFWVASIMFHTVPAFNHGFGYNNITYKCVTTDRNVKFIFFSAEYALPCLLMFFGGLNLICQIWKNVVRLRLSGATEEIVQNRLKSLVQWTKLVLFRLLLFLICVTPICVFNLYMLFSGKANVPLGIGLYMVYWLQYAVNTFIYVASNENYHRACRQTFLLIWREVLRWSGRWKRRSSEGTAYAVAAVPGLVSTDVPQITVSVIGVTSDITANNFGDTNRCRSISECRNSFVNERLSCSTENSSGSYLSLSSIVTSTRSTSNGTEISNL